MVNKYYQKHKEIIQKEAREKYQKLPGEERYKRRRKAQERYQNFTEEEKEKWRQYLRIWSHLVEKSSVENLIFCAVNVSKSYLSIEDIII